MSPTATASHLSELPAGLARMLTIIVAAFLTVGATYAEDAHAKKHKTNKPSISQNAAGGKGSAKTTYRASPSEESRAERERRLFRECRGMPNAGACLGFTRR